MNIENYNKGKEIQARLEQLEIVKASTIRARKDTSAYIMITKNNVGKDTFESILDMIFESCSTQIKELNKEFEKL